MSEHQQQFQTDLLDGKPARVHPSIALDIFRSIGYVCDMSAAEIARQAMCTRMTASRYVRGQASPTVLRFVRMMDRLGYDVILTRRDP